jgi:hypothetical protein
MFDVSTDILGRDIFDKKLERLFRKMGATMYVIGIEGNADTQPTTALRHIRKGDPVVILSNNGQSSNATIARAQKIRGGQAVTVAGRHSILWPGRRNSRKLSKDSKLTLRPRGIRILELSDRGVSSSMENRKARRSWKGCRKF